MAMPSTYKPEYSISARRIMGMGSTHKELAEALDVSHDTITKWKKEFPAFLRAIEDGMEDAIDNVEKSLYERAIGFAHPSEEIVVVSDGAKFGSHVERVAVTKKYPPDTAAAKLYLTNKRGRKWKDKSSTEVNMTVTLRQLIEATQTQKPVEPKAIEAADTERITDGYMPQTQVRIEESPDNG